MRAYAAVVLAGGAARRMGGTDKPARPVAGRPMRERVLAAVPDADPRILVGPPASAPAGVLVTREEPPGGGPVAALAAGLALVPPASTVVALLAADLPLLTRDAVGHLLRHLAARHPAEMVPVDLQPGGSDGAPVDGVCFVDGDGRRQTLCGVWWAVPLRAALDRLAAQRDGSLAGAPLRSLLAGLAVREVPWVSDGPPPWFDCDTDEDVRRAEEWVR